LNQEDSDFELRLTELCTKLNAGIAFDAVGGETAGIVAKCIVPKGLIITYGNLSKKKISVDGSTLRGTKKQWKGFSMWDWHAAKK